MHPPLYRTITNQHIFNAIGTIFILLFYKQNLFFCAQCLPHLDVHSFVLVDQLCLAK